MIELVYVSAASEDFSREEIFDLLKTSIVNNKERDITGMLLYVKGSFLQILEGEVKQVSELYDTIMEDDRHKNMVKLYESSIENRNFAEWSMGYAELSLSEIRKIPGCNDFFLTATSLSEVPSGIAKKILHGFRSGKWRQQLK